MLMLWRLYCGYILCSCKSNESVIKIALSPSTLRLHLERGSAPDHTHHRLSWCLYVPQEEGEDEEEGWLLAVSHGCEVRGENH